MRKQTHAGRSCVGRRIDLPIDCASKDVSRWAVCQLVRHMLESIAVQQPAYAYVFMRRKCARQRDARAWREEDVYECGMPLGETATSRTDAQHAALLAYVDVCLGMRAGEAMRSLLPAPRKRAKKNATRICSTRRSVF
jgi:hypothetical protein